MSAKNGTIQNQKRLPVDEKTIVFSDVARSDYLILPHGSIKISPKLLAFNY
jgi:hypothetical protein